MIPLSITLNTPTGDRELVFEFDVASETQAAMHASLAGGTFYEPETTLFLLNVLRAGDRFIDVGAHIGYFSVVASKVVGEAGEVVSFEPAPHNHARLLGHLALNRCGNVLPLPLAVGPREEIVTLHLNADNDGGHALWDVRQHPANAQSRAAPAAVRVWMTRIARVIGDKPVRAMKIDIEGAELGALLGAEPLLTGASAIPFVIAEINRTALEALGTNEHALRDWMDARGYDTWAMQVAEPQLQRLEPGVSIEGQYVFNVLFWKRGVSLT